MRAGWALRSGFLGFVEFSFGVETGCCGLVKIMFIDVLSTASLSFTRTITVQRVILM